MFTLQVANSTWRVKQPVFSTFTGWRWEWSWELTHSSTFFEQQEDGKRGDRQLDTGVRHSLHIKKKEEEKKRKKPCPRLKTDLFTFGVKSTRCFVEQKDLWVTNEGASNGYTLLLTTGQLSSLGANVCVVALPQANTTQIERVKSIQSFKLDFITNKQNSCKRPLERAQMQVWKTNKLKISNYRPRSALWINHVDYFGQTMQNAVNKTISTTSQLPTTNINHDDIYRSQGTGHQTCLEKDVSALYL